MSFGQIYAFAARSQQAAKLKPIVAANANVIYIYGFIDKEWGIAAVDVIGALAQMQGAVTLRISSDGGDVYEAQAMCAAIERYKGLGNTVNVAIDSMAASAASMLAMVGDVITIDEHALMMIHRPYTMAMGNADDLRKAGDVVALCELNTMVPYYASQSGKSVDEVKAVMAAETWYSAEQCVAEGFADKIENASDDTGATQVAALDSRRIAALKALYPNFPASALGSGNFPKPKPKPRVSGMNLALTLPETKFKA